MKHIKLFENFLNENTCSKICKECPFSKNSLPGFLADYTPQDIVDFMNREDLFPCHMMMPDENLDQSDVEKMIKNGELKLCRGYVESIIKSAKLPRNNKFLLDAMKCVRESGVSENSMPIWEFVKHHTKK